MRNDFRALCAELTEFVARLTKHYYEPAELLTRARAALADGPAVPTPPAALPEGYIDPEHSGDDRALLQTFYSTCLAEGGTADEITLRGLRAVLADEPAVPEGREPVSVTGQPSDEELLETLDKATATFPPRHPEAEGLNAVEYPLALELRKARAVLTRWGNPAPQPPAEGEVAELVRRLKMLASWRVQSDSCKLMLRRAAELLERLSPPQPVLVSERLPGPEDCDAEGRCWWGRNESDDWSADWTLATHEAVAEFCEFCPRTVWLPATALPLPGQEVEG